MSTLNPLNQNLINMQLNYEQLKGLGFNDNQIATYSQGVPGAAGPTGLDYVNTALGGLNAYVGYENLGLAKDQFSFNKDLANRNLANQGLAYNTALHDKAGIRAFNKGLTEGSAGYTTELAKHYNANTMADTTPIG